MLSSSPRLCRPRLIVYKACALFVLVLALFLTRAAHAGQYNPAYSCTLTVDGASRPFNPYGSNPSYGCNNGAILTITATMTWESQHPNDNPPVSVNFLETGTAAASGSGSVGAEASADNGMGDPSNTASSPITDGSGNTVGTNFTAGSSGKHIRSGYSGSVITLPTRTLSVTYGGGGSGYCGFSYEVDPTPIDLLLGGTTPDSSGNANILVGQHCTTSLSGFPSGTTVSGYQWSVSGTTFQSWGWHDPDPTDNTGYTSYVDGPGPLDQPTASWYWNDLMGSGASTPETVSCTATVTPPSGSGSPYTLSAKKMVNVYRPSWTAKGSGGEMRVSPDPYGYGNGDFWLWAAPLAGSGNTAGMVWDATVAGPPGTTFGNGNVQIVQLIIPNVSYTAPGPLGFPTTHTNPQNGQEGLDGSCPYGWSSTTPHYYGGDLPGIDLTGYNALSATMTHEFEDYLVYEPPGSAQYVPLAHFVWSTDGNVTIPASGNWADYTGSAGSIMPSGSPTDFPQSNSFPEWTQVSTADDF